MTRPDLSAHIGDIVRIILGKPNRALSNSHQLRFGTNGSVAVDITGPCRGDWYDHEQQVGGGAYEFISIEGRIPANEVNDWLKRHSFPYANGHDKASSTGWRNPSKIYDYRDESCTLLFQVCRFDNPKTFLQRAPNGRGGWIWKTKSIRKILYRLPELIAAPADQTVFICEGEKDTDRLTAGGLTATTNPGGAANRRDDGKSGKSKWQPEYNSFFAGRSVVILPDRDDAGRDHARSIAKNLGPIAREVHILELPDLPPKGDVSDWLDAGGTIEQLVALAKDAKPIATEEITQAELETEWARQQAALAALIERFNKKYAVVNEAGKVVIYQRIADPIIMNRKVIIRFSFADFCKLYQNEILSITKIGPDGKPKAISNSAANWWLNHSKRRTYKEGVVRDLTTHQFPAMMGLTN